MQIFCNSVVNGLAKRKARALTQALIVILSFLNNVNPILTFSQKVFYHQSME